MLAEEEHPLELTVVIPVFNELENLLPLHEQLTNVLRAHNPSYELIFIDDGSTDGSFERLNQISNQDPAVTVIRFRRNFGQTAAFSAGFDAARGEVVITMDADLQNDPEDIPRLLAEIERGYDVVSGWRFDRQDDFISRKLPSWFANFLISKITGVELHDYGCSLKAYRQDVIKNIQLYGEMHRFIPALASWMGIQVTEIKVNHRPRLFGQSKYGISRVMRVVLDLLTVKFLLDFATRPIQIFGLLGIMCFSLGTTLAGYLTYVKLVFGQDIGDRPLLLLAILLIVLGVQLITMGLLGELIVRIYYEAQDKPVYMVKQILRPPTADVGIVEEASPPQKT